MEETSLGAKQKAEHFLQHEQQFHLGYLPTEQSHAATVGLDEVTGRDVRKGIKLMQKVDQDIVPLAHRIFASLEYRELVAALKRSILSGKKVIFSGCGATGRLSILLEAAWRKFWQQQGNACARAAEFENRVFSIMTGGDYALIRSVESFEDYQEFGRRQTRELAVGDGDTFVAITEGGETSSVIGSAMQALDSNARAFVAFNNPAGLLCRHIERSRMLIEHSGTTILDLHTGPMALAGSTRLQAVTSELLVTGAALEQVIFEIAQEIELELELPNQDAPARVFERLLDNLGTAPIIEAMAGFIELEESVYADGGLVTYYANNILLDAFTDTTERAPTFMLPPFTKCDDLSSPRSWAFVKNPLYPTAQAWERVLGRPPRCLDWNRETYAEMRAAEHLIAAPPRLDRTELLKFKIGNEPAADRTRSNGSAAIALLADSDFDADIAPFLRKFQEAGKDHSQAIVMAIGNRAGQAQESARMRRVPCKIEKSPLRLWEHLAVKLVLNTVSTLTMARMGRIRSNWMSWVEATNKKLIDRSSRLIAELCEILYERACLELYCSLEEIDSNPSLTPRPSPVQHAMERIRNAQ